MAALALAGILLHLLLRYAFGSGLADLPLLTVLFIGGTPLVLRLGWRGLHGEFGSDHLAGVSIVGCALLDEYLAGAIVVLMLSGGETLEQFAVAQATSVLRALAERVCRRSRIDGGEAGSRMCPSPRSPSATSCRSSRTRSVPSTAKSSRGTARWTSPT